MYPTDARCSHNIVSFAKSISPKEQMLIQMFVQYFVKNL